MTEGVLTDDELSRIYYETLFAIDLGRITIAMEKRKRIEARRAQIGRLKTPLAASRPVDDTVPG